MVRFVACLHPTTTLSARQRWPVLIADQQALIGPSGLKVIVALDLTDGGRRTTPQVDITDGSRVRISPPEDAGTKTGQMRTVKAAFDGGHVSALFKYKSRAARWELDGATVEWSLAKATSREAETVRRLVKASEPERERHPLADAARPRPTEERIARHLANVDEDIASQERVIAEAEQSLVRLRADRDKFVVETATDAARAAAEDAARADTRARIDALVDDVYGTPP